MRILYILGLVFDAIAIMDILQSRKDLEKKILWIILVLVLPVIGAVLYFALGRGR